MVEVPGGRVWYERVGSGDAVPLLALHGGPGFTHEYLRSLEALADTRPVVFYDQLGCGRSDRPRDPSLWTVERSVAELQAVRDALGLTRMHLLGHSWGSMLATEYALGRPAGILTLTLASPCISITRWIQDADRLKQGLPEEVQRTIDEHERIGSTACLEYAAATLVYYRRHVCRMNPWPLELEKAYAGVGNEVYETMWGPSEFTVTGPLRTFDRSDRLHEIDIPTLFTCGRYDEATPETVAWYQRQLPGAELAVFEESAHLAPLEERERYQAVVREWMAREETRAG
jgi:proline iminopeptidase